MNDRIERIEDRLAQREARLRSQFTRLEQLSAGFQQQGQSLGVLGAGFGRF
jgi:flagellar capping protein FliD